MCYSVPELRDSSPIHWIDNTSAIAALIKGYAGAPDSARLLHAFEEYAFGFGINPWFQWVPSSANIADLPSRGELDMLKNELSAHERQISFPPFPAWEAEALDWVRTGAAATSIQGASRQREFRRNRCRQSSVV